jgi:acyl-CoA synthetase (AMP-forming)/AMP-acid ligase II
MVEALSGWAIQTPEATAFQFVDPDPNQERSLSFAQLDYLARQLGEVLSAQVPPGARGRWFACMRSIMS